MGIQRVPRNSVVTGAESEDSHPFVEELVTDSGEDANLVEAVALLALSLQALKLHEEMARVGQQQYLRTAMKSVSKRFQHLVSKTLGYGWTMGYRNLWTPVAKSFGYCLPRAPVPVPLN